LFYRRGRRGDSLAPIWLAILPPLALLGTTSWLWAVVRDGHDPNAREQPGLDRFTEQNLELGKRVPGFQYPDQNGRITRLSDFPGRILIIAIWSPGEAESVNILAHLNAIHLAHRAQGIQP